MGDGEWGMGNCELRIANCELRIATGELLLSAAGLTVLNFVYILFNKNTYFRTFVVSNAFISSLKYNNDLRNAGFALKSNT
ncbi:MAG: hypothetical protein KME64_29145 [Scytonematopsis contorta HA4267-MV1]|jgi:hypothetical protein|nr:hypothetical protein [Scytonematopsis contorta HA4267-MV1]